MRVSKGLGASCLALAAALGLGGLATTSPAYAQEAQQARSFDIPAQSLDSALQAFAAQTDRSVLYTPEMVAGKTSPGVHGNVTASQALDALLAGSGLNFQLTASGGFAVQDPNSPMRLGDASGAASSDGGATAEILVLGSRTLNTDIRRTQDDPQPYVVFDRERIQNSGADTLEDFFRNNLPMNTAQASGAQVQATDNQQAIRPNSTITLRGLSANQTLILVDGRRVPRLQNLQEDFDQGDLNGIPLASIERIEVLPSTAGGIYGGGALGGVINVILRRDYRGLDLAISGAGTFSGGANDSRIELSGGFSPNNGRTRFSGSLARAELAPVYVGENDLWERARDRAFQLHPNIAQSWTGSEVNIFANTNLVLRDGTPLNSTFASVPVGYMGVSSDGGAGLLAGAGVLNTDLSPQKAQYELRTGSTLTAANFDVRHEFSSSLEGFVDYTMSRTGADGHGRISDVGVGGSIALSASDPGNPFLQPIFIRLPIYDVTVPRSTEIENDAVTAGLIWHIGGGWAATAEYNQSRTSSEIHYEINPLSTGPLQAAIRNGTIDVFRDLQSNPISYAPYLNPIAAYYGPIETEQDSVSARVAGPLIDLWGGAITATALVEHRNENADAYTWHPAFEDAYYTASRSQSVTSAYLEFSAPILSEGNHVPLIHALEADISFRYDRYSTSSPLPTDVTPYDAGTPLPDFDYTTAEQSAVSYTAALRWQPVEDLTFRTSYSTGFLPPSISQIVRIPLGTIVDSFIPDPARGGEVLGPVDFAYGGNPDLKPEESRSFSFGLIWSPAFLPGLRASVDYSRIRKTDEISFVDITYLLANEDSFPGRITRDPASPSDIALGYRGPVTAIDDGLLNVSHTDIEAIDLQLSYETDLGDFGDVRVFASATQQSQFTRQILPTDTGYDSVGYYDGPLEWRANGGVTWELGSWGLAWNTRYFDSYSVRAANPSLAALNPFYVANQGAERIPGQIYHDFMLRYRFEDTPLTALSGVELSLGVQNVFDTRPPIDLSRVNIGANVYSAYSSYGDPRLRRFSVALRKHF